MSSGKQLLRCRHITTFRSCKNRNVAFVNNGPTAPNIAFTQGARDLREDLLNRRAWALGTLLRAALPRYGAS
jgi:hypothetical protein